MVHFVPKYNYGDLGRNTWLVTRWARAVMSGNDAVSMVSPSPR